MLIKQFLQNYTSSEVIDIVAQVLGLDKTKVLVGDTEILEPQLTTIQEKVARLQNGEPLAYILGFKYFYGLKFEVNRNVLIPRPETETLVDLALHTLPLYRNCEKVVILDMGTGSGCVAISIAKNLPEEFSKVTQIHACDISLTALETARVNAQNHHVKVNFFHSDLFAKIDQKFDIITANLPYVPISRLPHLATVQKEPTLALTDGTDDWQIYARFFQDLPEFLKDNGIAILEIDEASTEILEDLLQKYLPTFTWEFSRDLNGLWRYLVIRK